jgi:hypothetical protein
METPRCLSMNSSVMLDRTRARKAFEAKLREEKASKNNAEVKPQQKLFLSERSSNEKTFNEVMDEQLALERECAYDDARFD